MVCQMAGVLAECLSRTPGRWCLPCSELDVGESLTDLRIRSGLGYTKNRYAKWKAANDAAIALERRRWARGSSRYE